MQDGEIYYITITIRPYSPAVDDDRQASTSITILARDNDAPNITFKDIGSRVVSHKALRLQMTQSGDLDSSLSWHQVLGPALNSEDYSTPTNLSYLVIEANKLIEGNTYRFAL